MSWLNGARTITPIEEISGFSGPSIWTLWDKALYEFARGIDHSVVVPNCQHQSISAQVM